MIRRDAERADRIRVESPMTLATARELLVSGEKIFNAESGQLVVDLSGVGEADSSALAVLLAWRRAAGGGFDLENAPEGLRALSALYDLDALLHLK
jgi:phospholipid transport system transporter-binding protein